MVRLKLFGLKVSVKRLRGVESDKHNRLLALSEHTISHTPDLRDTSRQARFSMVGQLIELGWSGEQVARLVNRVCCIDL